MLHIKALLFSFLEPEEQGLGIIMGAPCPHPVTFFAPFLSEVMDAKWDCWNKNWMICIKSPYLRIPKIIRILLQCHWIKKKVGLKCINLSPQTVYKKYAYALAQNESVFRVLGIYNFVLLLDDLKQFSITYLFRNDGHGR